MESQAKIVNSIKEVYCNIKAKVEYKPTDYFDILA